jgi:hypothetical protein
MQPFVSGPSALTSFGEGANGELYATVGNDVVQLVSTTTVPIASSAPWRSALTSVMAILGVLVLRQRGTVSSQRRRPWPRRGRAVRRSRRSGQSVPTECDAGVLRLHRMLLAIAPITADATASNANRPRTHAICLRRRPPLNDLASSRSSIASAIDGFIDV